MEVERKLQSTKNAFKISSEYSFLEDCDDRERGRNL